MRIVSERLHNQKLSATTFRQPVEVVRWMGAVQAQDYYGAKWALGLRMRAATDQAIEDAFNNGEIIRTHVLRPTWHFVAPEDIRWLLELTGPRVDLRCGSGYRMFELDAAVFKKSNRAISKALDGKHLTRSELKAVLNRAGVAADNGIRLGHILIRAELDRVVCSGPRKGKQFTYALFDERVPPGKSIARDEALGELTRRYFRSHGPASLQDFVWWSGLTTEDARRGIEMSDRNLTTTTIDNKIYFAHVSRSNPLRSPHPPNLLPAFDEYNVAYKDRGLVNDLMPAWNALGPSVISDGKIVGTWKALVNGRNVTIHVDPARPLKKPELKSLTEVADRYATFLGRDKGSTEIRHTKL